MELQEIRARISEMGISAGRGSEENAKIIYSLLIAINGSGLVASLAFIGAVLGAKIHILHMPFYWCVIFFGVGILTGFISLLSNYFYFRFAVQRYHTSYLEVDPITLTDIASYIPVLTALKTPTCGQVICSYLMKYLPIISTIFFTLGLIVGVMNLNELNNIFQATLTGG
jgi:hypothetical protein